MRSAPMLVLVDVDEANVTECLQSTIASLPVFAASRDGTEPPLRI